jgi:hypothetical protein
MTKYTESFTVIVCLLEGSAMVTERGLDFYRVLFVQVPYRTFSYFKNVCMSVGMQCAHMRDENLYNTLFNQAKR